MLGTVGAGGGGAVMKTGNPLPSELSFTGMGRQIPHMSDGDMDSGEGGKVTILSKPGMCHWEGDYFSKALRAVRGHASRERLRVLDWGKCKGPSPSASLKDTQEAKRGWSM